jgi:hypothetical protein
MTIGENPPDRYEVVVEGLLRAFVPQENQLDVSTQHQSSPQRLGEERRRRIHRYLPAPRRQWEFPRVVRQESLELPLLSGASR